MLKSNGSEEYSHIKVEYFHNAKYVVKRKFWHPISDRQKIGL